MSCFLFRPGSPIKSGNQALCDIDVPDNGTDQAVAAPEPQQARSASSPQQPQKAVSPIIQKNKVGQPMAPAQHAGDQARLAGNSSKASFLATPAVRGLLQEHQIHHSEVNGSGKDGRILKEDVHNLLSTRNQVAASRHESARSTSQPEASVSLTPTQAHMFKTMTRSLSVPHFSYADEIDVTHVSALRRDLNTSGVSSSADPKLSLLPFVIKALSLSLQFFPLLNARIEVSSSRSDNPQIILRSVHNIGIAMDTPSGLLVPIIKDVASLSIHDIAIEIRRLRSSALANKLTMDDISHGTITVSNIGSIGGTYVSPIIASAEQVAILGVGRARRVPAFVTGEDGRDTVEAREVCCLSWSADHRVVDGATVARCGDKVREYLENPGHMIATMR